MGEGTEAGKMDQMWVGPSKMWIFPSMQGANALGKKSFQKVVENQVWEGHIEETEKPDSGQLGTVSCGCSPKPSWSANVKVDQILHVEATSVSLSHL